MRTERYSNIFEKKFKKLKGQELRSVVNKIKELLSCEDINHYKNLKYDLKQYKRVHVNDSYVILFFGDDGTVWFVDYAHHDDIYKHSKKALKKYQDLKFE